ncbi:MAG: alpha/beta hydrolase-fold protein [Pirellulaceae bacterium]
MHRVVLGTGWLLLFAWQNTGLAAEAVVSAASLGEDGVRRHTVRSPYQAGETEIAVLSPASFDESKRYRVVYVLPVESHGKHRYGDGLAEVLRRELHRKRDVIFVAPSFAALPWFADHPEDEGLRQESHLLKVVIPFVEKNYPVIAERRGRLLLGFSKSGWGAWTLLLRHRETFERAAAWDAPLMMQSVGKYGNGPLFGTQENFEKYRVTDLLEASRTALRGEARLVLTGYGSFRREHQQAHELLKRLEIPHVYRDGPQRKHDWHGDWVSEAVELLLVDKLLQEASSDLP